MLPENDVVRALHPPDPSTAWVLTGLDRASMFMVLNGSWVFEGGLDAQDMKQGLSRLLDDYPQLAGRMEKGQRVRLDDSGVPFSWQERPDLGLQQLLEDHTLAKQLRDPVKTGRVKRGTQAPLSTRVTQLADAQVLSVSCAHACMDGNSFYSFVRNWGQACRGEPWPEVVLDPSLLPRNPARSKAEAKLAAKELGWARPSLLGLVPVAWAMFTGKLTLRSQAIHLGEQALAALRAAAERDAGGVALSDNDILTAHLSLACARLFDHGEDTRCTQVVVHDARGRLEHVPAGFVGNASYSAVGAEHHPGDSLGSVAASTHAALEPYLVRPSERTTQQVAMALELMDHGLFLSHFDLTRMHAARPTLCYCNNFAKLPIYEIAFGTTSQPVRPLRVIPHDLPDPVLFWPAPPGQGGLEVYLTGSPAVAASKLSPEDPWWAALRGQTV